MDTGGPGREESCGCAHKFSMRSFAAVIASVVAAASLADAKQLRVRTSLLGDTVQIDPWGADSVRVRRVPASGAISDPAIQALVPVNVTKGSECLAWDEDEGVSVEVDEKSGWASLTNGNLQATVNQTSGLVVFTRVSDGAVLLQETSVAFGAPVNPSPARASSYYSVQASFFSSASESLYGFGEHRTGTVNQRPYYGNFELSQVYSVSHGSDISIPVYHSSRGYGFVWNTPAYGWVNATSAGQVTWFANSTAQLDYWIGSSPATPDPQPPLPLSTLGVDSPNSTFAATLRRVSDAIGHSTILPASVRGLIQSKNRYRNQTQLLGVVEQYIALQLPLDMIVIDYLHWVNFGDWSFNAACWPDIPALVSTLEEYGVRLMVSMWPTLTPAGSHFNEFNTSGLLLHRLNQPPTTYDGAFGGLYDYDPFNPSATAAYFAALSEGYFNYSLLIAPWTDASELETVYVPYPDWQTYAGSTAEVGSAFPRAHDGALYENLVAAGAPAEETVILTRSAWAGSQRYGSIVWSGDIATTFQELTLQVRAIQGMQISLFGFSCTDTAGYNGGDPTDPAYQELMARWFAFSTFTAVQRLHGDRAGGPPADSCGPTDGDNEPWAYGNTTYTVMAQMILLRDQLRDYTGLISAYASLTGTPMMRALALQFPNDPRCAANLVEDEFTYGPDWLVAPVLVQGATNRTVYFPVLPAGQSWTYFYDGSTYEGGSTVLAFPTPLDENPIFFRNISSYGKLLRDLPAVVPLSTLQK
jgi:alpha-D-xyloside xylohydrolase